MQEKEMKNSEELIKYKDLIDTVIEGLNYVSSKLIIGEVNKSIKVFTEMITGINAVISGLENKTTTNSEGMKESKVKLDEYLELLVTAFEQGDIKYVMLKIDTKLIPIMKEIQNYCY